MGRKPDAAPAATLLPRMPGDVAAVFAAVPPGARSMMMDLRSLIHERAAVADAGALTEALKWGEPAFLTSESKSGSTIRVAWKTRAPDQIGVYFNCQTTLVSDFRTLFPQGLRFEDNRAILLRIDTRIPREALGMCLGMALTYHRDKRRR